MTVERIPNLESIEEIIACKDYNLSPHHKSILKRIAKHIAQYNPTENAYILEMSKDDAIKVIKLLNK